MNGCRQRVLSEGSPNKTWYCKDIVWISRYSFPPVFHTDAIQPKISWGERQGRRPPAWTEHQTSWINAFSVRQPHIFLIRFHPKIIKPLGLSYLRQTPSSYASCYISEKKILRMRTILQEKKPIGRLLITGSNEYSSHNKLDYCGFVIKWEHQFIQTPGAYTEYFETEYITPTVLYVFCR